MLRSLVVFLLFTLSLSALSNSEILKRANSFVNSSSKSNQFRAYNDYKNLYLRALMNEDKKLKLKALVGIVKSGDKLHIDISQYSDELTSLKPKSSYKAPTPKKLTSSKKFKIKSSHKLKSIRWKSKKLLLSFDKKLRNNQINYFTNYDKKTKKYNYIFDIHASMLIRSQNLRKEGIDSIKLSQHNSSTLRLIISNRSKVSIRFKKSAKELLINITSKNYKKAKTIIAKTKTPKRLDRNKVIVIDAGHGGKDPGAVGYKRYREKVVVLQIAQEFKRILKSRGYKVYMTRDSDKFVRLRNRTRYANKKKADLFISIHANSVGKKHAKSVHGLECYYLDKSRSSRAKRVAASENKADMNEMDFYGKESFLNTLNSHNIVAANKLAIDLQRATLSSLQKNYKNVKDAGVRQGPFWVLVGAQMPAVLVEVGFISNPSEAKRLIDRKYQKRMALGLANGVERYFLNN